MKKSIAAVLMAFCITGCNAQEHKDNKVISKQSGSQPVIGSKVTKKYDDKGNVIGYDSTYVWSYSNKSGNMQHVEVDSVMKQFQKQFDSSFPSIFNEQFGKTIWDDSLFYKNFIRPDYFMNKWKDQSFDIGRMMQQMDSMRDQFFDKNYPGLLRGQKK
ncbi:MAG TPA: hypothetical protein VN721_09105 [Flavipsychrobacter sp.]|nr:hypothetical protein [Flavipsychrobacter sp.]